MSIEVEYMVAKAAENETRVELLVLEAQERELHAKVVEAKVRLQRAVADVYRLGKLVQVRKNVR